MSTFETLQFIVKASIQFKPFKSAFQIDLTKTQTLLPKILFVKAVL